MSQSFLQRSSFDSWPIAKPIHRSIAFLVDSIIVLVIVVGLMKLFSFRVHWQNTPFFWLISMWFWEAFFGIFTGSSPGKRLLSLELYSPRYDGAPSPVQISLRIIMFWVSVFLLGIGLLPILYRRDHRGWHDLVAETLVIGTARSSPSPLAIRWAPDIILVLSLLLFSGIGAHIFSTGIKNSQIAAYNVKSCDSPDALVRNTKQVLVGLVISPAFTNCWQAIETTNQNIQDSKVYQLAHIAKNFHHYILMPLEGRKSFFENSIQPSIDNLCKSPSKECNSANFLNSLKNDEDIIFSENYFADYSLVLKELITTPPEEVIQVAKKQAKSVEDTWVALLHKELWIALQPEILDSFSIVTNNRDWVQAVDCLNRIDQNKSTANCDLIQLAHYAFASMQRGDFEAADDYLGSKPRDFIYEELRQLRDYYSAKLEGDEPKMKAFVTSYPLDSVFAPSFNKSK